jgi:hypothetical protein
MILQSASHLVPLTSLIGSVVVAVKPVRSKSKRADPIKVLGGVTRDLVASEARIKIPARYIVKDRTVS